MDTPLIELESIKYIGISQYGNVNEVNIGKVWGKLFELIKEYKDSEINNTTYGIQLYHPSYPKQFDFTYFASIESNGVNDLPFVLLEKTLPKAKYATFKSPKGLETIRETWQYSINDWLPKSEYNRKFPYVIEVYKPNIDKAHCQSDIYVYIPIIEK